MRKTIAAVDESLKNLGLDYSFVLQNGINPLTKTVRAERMLENADVFDFEIAEQDMKQIASLPEMGFTGWRPEEAPADALVNG